MATMNKIVSFFTKTNGGAAKVTQTGLPPTVQTIAETVEKALLYRQFSSHQPNDESGTGTSVWSPRSGYRTTPLARQTLEASSANSDTQSSQPLSEPPPRYSDSVLHYVPDEKDYTANLGSPIYCCSTFDDPLVTPPPQKETTVQQEEYVWKNSERVRVLNLEPTEAMVDDPSGEIYAPLRPGESVP